MKNRLTKDEIQFIDNYLLKADIQYEDLRIEMIDHVASEIEHQMSVEDNKGFYEIFKAYMIKNKAELEKQGKPFQWKILKSLLISLLKNLGAWQVVLGSILCFVLFVGFNRYIHEIEGVGLMFFPILLMMIVLLRPFILFRKRKFSFIGNFGILLTPYVTISYQIAPYIGNQSAVFYLYLIVLILVFVGSFKTI